MNGPEDSAASVDVRTTLWSFFVRVALIATVLAVPVLGTSFALVSQINHDISLARSERSTLVHFDRIRSVFEAIDGLRVRAERRDPAGVRRERETIDRAIASARLTYGAPAPAANDFWLRVRASWAQAKSSPTTANLDAVLDALGEAGNEFEGNSSLDQDPNVAVLNLVDVFLRKAPRSIVALSETRDAVVIAAERERLDVQMAERISRKRAVEQQAVTVGLSDIALATSIEPELQERFATLFQATQARTAIFDRRVDAVLAARLPVGQSKQPVDTAARRAIAAHFALWRRAAIEADRIVLRRLAGQIVRRRIIIVFACLAIVAGALGVTSISRYEARRDRIELQSAKLESDKLRAEVERISIERDLRIREAQFRVIFENADLGIATFDRYGKILQCNTAVKRMLGTAAQNLLSQQVDVVRKFEASGFQPFTREEARTADDSRPQWLALTFSGVYDENVCELVILLIRDITEEKLLAQQLAYDAGHDGLTGLTNRAAFDEILRQALVDVEAAPFAVMYIDLDKFKPVNDTFGHRAGDHVLVTTAERLRGAVGAQDVCARLGGDEFAILLRGVDSTAPIMLIAERIAANVALPISYQSDTKLSVTASIGIAIGSMRYASADEIKHDADLALYAVKERGRNGFLINNRSIQQPSGVA